MTGVDPEPGEGASLSPGGGRAGQFRGATTVENQPGSHAHAEYERPQHPQSASSRAPGDRHGCDTVHGCNCNLSQRASCPSGHVPLRKPTHSHVCREPFPPPQTSEKQCKELLLRSKIIQPCTPGLMEEIPREKGASFCAQTEPSIRPSRPCPAWRGLALPPHQPLLSISSYCAPKTPPTPPSQSTPSRPQEIRLLQPFTSALALPEAAYYTHFTTMASLVRKECSVPLTGNQGLVRFQTARLWEKSGKSGFCFSSTPFF
jgi:hypothetical protein